MVFFNHATRQMTAKIVYYGPGLCGKTTNLNTIYGKTSQKARGEMVSLNTETDRTLFFDLLPMDVGMVGGFKTKLQLYTVPGQVFYNSTRKLVLKGVDGIVFVVDSQTPMLDACKESYQNLQENLKELGLNLDEIPLVYQWNKRDLKSVVGVDELERTFNGKGLPSFQAVASDGSGVFETLRGITKLALGHIKSHVLGEGTSPGTAAPVPAKPAPAPAPVAPPAPAPAAVHSPSNPTPAKPLALSDLPAVSDLLKAEERTDSLIIEPPVLPDHPDDLASAKNPGLDTRPVNVKEVAAAVAAKEAERAAPAPAAVAPAPAPAPIAAPRPAPAPVPAPARVAPPSVPKIPIPLPPKPPVAAAKPASAAPLSNLLGELTQVGRVGSPSVLRVELPEVEGEIEIVVQVKAKGEVIGESQLKRTAPIPGVTAKITLELKRS